MTLVLDAGALVALERGERPMWVRLKGARTRGEVPVTHAGILGQVWRGGSRQARLSQALAGVDVREIDEALGRAAGELLAATETKDVLDAALVILAEDGDNIASTDSDDLALLAAARGLHVELLHP